ncbi:MAG: TetR-like C-terminal domain-containing protein, partial [Oscillospiraceae bacterium]|nr:TetR-like C-terminal domain-containing protein [Oscillospiraceae bacterium]
IGRVYIAFAQEHPYLYETIQWVNLWADTASQDIFSDIMRLAWEEGAKMGMTEVESNHMIRCLRCLVHGFASIEGHHGFGYKVSAQESFEYALDMFILGISTRLKKERAELPKE